MNTHNSRYNLGSIVIVTKMTPRSIPSLGWLLGLFYQGSVPSLASLVAMLLVSFFKIRRDKHKLSEQCKEPTKHQNQGKDRQHKNCKKERAKDIDDISNLPNQRFVVRKRNKQGQLKHVATFDRPPSREDLKLYGSGEYSILTTKPNLKHWARIQIEPTKKIQKPRRPKTSREKKSHYIPPPPKLIGAKINERRIRQRKNPSRAQKPPPPPQEDSTQDPNSKYSPNSYDVQTQDTMGNPSQLKKHHNSRQDSVRIPQIVEIVEASPLMKIKEKYVDEEQPIIKQIIALGECHKCGFLQDTFSRCDFCGEMFCDKEFRDCLMKHNCPESASCYICHKRYPLVDENIETYCGNTFCSTRCQDQCIEKNRYNQKCKPCIDEDTDDEKEEEEDGEDEEEEDEEDEEQEDDEAEDLEDDEEDEGWEESDEE